jgi:aminoglycoside phosphotransferase (APT) family kinase protein
MGPSVPGELIGKGRDCDVYAAGPGRVLRRNRGGRSTEAEALTMRHVAVHGYPVPEVFDAVGPDIVMERLDGHTMAESLTKQPWKLRMFGRQLASLVEQLGTLPLPDHDMAERVPAGDVLLHLDLHPLNVMETSRGPVVIDWTGACAGQPGVDAANTWLTVAAGQLEGSRVEQLIVKLGRGLFLRSFLGSSDLALARPQLETAMTFRRTDPNLSAGELSTMEAVVAKQH